MEIRNIVVVVLIVVSVFVSLSLYLVFLITVWYFCDVVNKVFCDLDFQVIKYQKILQKTIQKQKIYRVRAKLGTHEKKKTTTNSLISCLF